MKQISMFEHRLADQTLSGAILSECGKYRYSLWRCLNLSGPFLGWLMCNPSTADADQDDPTIRKIRNISVNHGFAGFYVCNIYAWRATDPNELWKTSEDIKGIDNTHHIHEVNKKVSAWVLAYGQNPRQEDVDKMILELQLYGKPLKALKLAKNGRPWHPLYCKNDSVLLPFH